MSKRFTIITKDGSKWLRPINPFDNNDPRFTSKEPFCILGMRPCSKTVCECDEWKKFEKNNPILPYIGSHPEGTVLDESEVREVRQRKRTDRTNADWQDMFDGIVPLPIDYHETRTAYTDAEPTYSETFKQLSAMITSDQLDDMQDLIGSEKSHDSHISGWTHVSDALPDHLETVWISNGKGFTTLGCLVCTEDGWHWAATNGVIYEENGRIVSECESDDIDAEYWHRLPDALKIDKEESK